VAQVVKGMNSYAATMLGKNPISTGRVRWRTMPIVNAHYGVCVIELLALAGWHGERKSGGLQIGHFMEGLHLSTKYYFVYVCRQY
jgi:hypothetical protein